MESSNNLLQSCDLTPAGASDPETALRCAAQIMLTHAMTLEAERETADMLRAMGVSSPTGADGLMLSQYLKALRGDTSSAKFVREAAALHPEAGQGADCGQDLSQLSDRELYLLATEAEP